jgi:hypothetical protein
MADARARLARHVGGWTFKHKSDALGFPALHVVHDFLDARDVIHELLDGANRFAFVDGDIGFAEMRHGPFHVGASGLAKAARGLQTNPQGGFSSGELAEQCLPLAFNRLEFAGIHSCSFPELASGSTGAFSASTSLSYGSTKISEIQATFLFWSANLFKTIAVVAGRLALPETEDVGEADTDRHERDEEGSQQGGCSS